MEKTDQSRLSIWAFGLAIAAFIAIFYANSFHCPFILDDQMNIEQNLSIRSLWPPYRVLIGSRMNGISGRPFANLSFALNYAIGGLNVTSYHIFNLIIHILNALLLFGIIWRTLRRYDACKNQAISIGFVASLIWSLHPLCTASVTYVTQRIESLMGLCLLLTLYCAIRWWEIPSQKKWMFLSSLFFFLGCGIKEVIVVAPILVYCYELTVLKRGIKSAFQTSRMLYALYVPGYLFLSLMLLHGGTAKMAYDLHGPTPHLTYFMAQPQAIVSYLSLVLFPHGLCLDHPNIVPTRLSFILYAIPLLLLFFVTGYGIWRKNPLSFLGAWFFLILAPTSSFVPIFRNMEEQRMYLPLAGIAFLFVFALNFLLKKFTNGRPSVAKAGGTILVISGIFLGVLLGLTTHYRNNDYATERSIWKDNVSKTPENKNAWLGLALAYSWSGKKHQAEATFRKVLAIAPENPEALYDFGGFLFKEGKLMLALHYFEKAVRFGKDSNLLYLCQSNLGTLLAILGKKDEAKIHLQKSIMTFGDYAPAHFNLGNLYVELGQGDAALNQYQETIRIDPTYPKAHYHMAEIYYDRHDVEGSARHLQQEIRNNPMDWGAHHLLGLIRIEQKDWEAALTQLKSAFFLHPSSEGANDFGAALFAMKHHKEALAMFRLALRLDPKNQNAKKNIVKCKKSVPGP